MTTTTKTDGIPSITSTSTKKEMLDAYNNLLKVIETRAQTELKPEKAKAEREKQDVVQTADALATHKVIKAVNELIGETSKALTDIAIKIEEETERYNKLKRAIDIKEAELRELFEIEKSAFTMAALLEAQKQQRISFEDEMARRKELLELEINQMKTGWETQKKEYAEELKDQREHEAKRRQREKEEYEYRLEREKEQKINALNDEVNKLDKDLREKKEEFDKQTKSKEIELKEREQAVGEREKVMDDLQTKVDAFPRELENAIDKAVKELTLKLTSEAGKNEQLLVKGFEGEKNVLQARIDAFEQAIATQKKQIEKLTEQLENAYGKVQDIAVRAVAGPSRQNASTMMAKSSSSEQE
jgi:DNA repair exonuclease SbcCD ATPase subunit